MFQKIKKNINNYTKLLEKLIKKNQKKRKNIKSNLLLTKTDEVKFRKKRKNINIDFSKIKLWWENKKKIIPYFLISIILLIVILIIVMLSPIFKVKYIEITKLDNITNMDIAYKSVEDFRWKTIFNIKEMDVFNKLKNYQDNIRILDLNIQLPNTLKIKIGSFKKIYNVNIEWKNYIILENGSLIPKSKVDEDLNTLIVEKDFWESMFLDYRNVFDPIYILKIKEIQRVIKDNIIDINIKELKYYENERELHILTENDVIFIFSLDSSDNIENQIRNLIIFNNESQQISKSDIYYIDLRIQNKIFHCPNENINQCEKNIKSIYSE